MTSNQIIGLVVVLAIVVAGFFFFNSGNNSLENLNPAGENVMEETDDAMDITKESNDTEDAAAPQTIQVTYTDNGFTPARVEIKVGDTVEWVNEGSNPMWVASAVHPTHTVYPEKSADDCLGSSFDACENISASGTYSFTFNTPGEWGYHNHSRANHTGMVVVTE